MRITEELRRFKDSVQVHEKSKITKLNFLIKATVFFHLKMTAQKSIQPSPSCCEATVLTTAPTVSTSSVLQFPDLQHDEQHPCHRHSAPCWPGTGLFKFGCLPSVNQAH